MIALFASMTDSGGEGSSDWCVAYFTTQEKCDSFKKEAESKFKELMFFSVPDWEEPPVDPTDVEKTLMPNSWEEWLFRDTP